MKIFFIASFIGLLNLAHAQTFNCTLGKANRKIEAVQSEKGPKCETKYTKEDGSTKTIYKAENEADFCGKKAKELSEKLKGMGWDCKE